VYEPVLARIPCMAFRGADTTRFALASAEIETDAPVLEAAYNVMGV